jgi:Beta-lactamase class C and other penicillin binding proteins
MRKNFLLLLFAALSLSFAVSSCHGGDDPLNPKDEPEKKSNAANLSSFFLKKTSNPSLPQDVDAYFAGTVIKFSIPESTDPKTLVPVLTISDKATAYINEAKYESGKSYDFSKSTIIKVVSESETVTKTFTVEWENGDNFIDNYIFKLMDQCDIPGISFSVMKGSKVVYSKGYGYSNVATGERVTPDHLFRMASISKQFCTMCIMMLKEEGKLSLDDQVFGDKGILKGIYKNITSYHEGITVRHLLSHSSGICAGLDDPAFNGKYRYYNGNSSTPVPADTLIQRTIDDRQYPYVSGSASYAPGALYNYSNVGFCILHRIVEVVSGKDYESYLKEDVLAKMGITDTHIGGYEYERRSNECVLYSQGGGNGYLNPLRTLAGAAGIITSTNQMMKILTYMDGKSDVPDIFSPATIAEMYTPYRYSADASRNTYGLGWRMNNSKRFKNSHFHGGNMAGTATMWVGGATGDSKDDFDDLMSGAIVCNSRSYDSSLDWVTSWGNSSGNDIDDSFYIILGEAFRHFR